MTSIFFYGLFMDRSLLVGQGLHPEVVGPAVLHDYRIHIGARATLVPAPSSRAYGVVMNLTDAEAEALYAEPSVRAYRPEAVEVRILADDRIVAADCYNLPRDTDLAGANPDYATRLSRLAADLGFDAGYVREIAAFAEEEDV